MKTYLQVKALEKRYGNITALAGIDFHVARGSILGLLGPNGAGKSTLFGCLLGFTQPTSGEVLLGDRIIDESMRARFGYVSERVALYPQRTVSENGMFFTSLKGCAAAEFERQLDRVGLFNARDRKVRELSKGMLQRLGLAIALCGEPDLLVLDEPFSGLDPALLDSLQTILHEENQRGATLLISTHTISAIEALATHIAILLRGKLAAFDTLSSLLESYECRGSLESIYHTIARSTRAELQEVC